MNRMLTLEETIRHCEEEAQAAENTCESKGLHLPKYLGRAAEYRQLASWLKLLKEIMDCGDCNVCSVKKYCRYVPEIGDKVRYNCPFYNGRIWHDGEVGESE